MSWGEGDFVSGEIASVLSKTNLFVAPLHIAFLHEALVAQVVVPPPLVGVLVHAETAVLRHGRPVLRM